VGITETLEAAYKILSAFEYHDPEVPLGAEIAPEVLGIDPLRWRDVMQSLIDEGYITGVRIRPDENGVPCARLRGARITLKGAQYLAENSFMQKIARTAGDLIRLSK